MELNRECKQSQFPEESGIIGQQGFTDVKPREDFLLQQKDAPASPGQIGGGAAAAWTAANYAGVVMGAAHTQTII